MIKVGVVGYGFMGKMHSQCYEATGEAKVVAVADGEADRREEARAKLRCETYQNAQEMLASADIDIVDVCTPTYLHEEHVIAAANAGKDVICEKPMALSVESCDAMIGAVKAAGTKLMIAHVIRFWPEYQAIKDIVDSGKYGSVQWVSARRLGPAAVWSWQGWFLDPSKSGGAVLDLHIHDADYIAYLIGSPGKIQARGAQGSMGGLDSILSVGWEHPNGASSYAEGSLALAPGFPFTMALLVACEKATIKYYSGKAPSLTVYPFEGEPFTPKLPTPDVGASAEAGGNIASLGGYYNEIKYFLDCVKAGKRPEIVTPESSREAVRLCLAARKSAETGTTLRSSDTSLRSTSETMDLR